jgi:hypothetical protein
LFKMIKIVERISFDTARNLEIGHFGRFSKNRQFRPYINGRNWRFFENRQKS